MMMKGISSGELSARLYEIRRQERGLLVEFLAMLGELEERRAFVEMGFSSGFVYCTEYLGLSKAGAFRRTTAARLLRAFPQIGDYLQDGRLGLTTLVALRDALEPTTVDSVLGRAAGKCEDEVKLLVASLRPQPDALPLLRRLPETTVTTETAETAETTRAAIATGGTTPARSGLRPSVEPLSEQRRLLRVTIGADVATKLERIGAMLSHQHNGGDLEKLIGTCVETTLEVLEKRQRGTGGRGAREARTDRRYVAKVIRRAVWERDEGRCAFVAAEGRRCGETRRLELHHLRAFAKGGPTTAENLSLRCQAHNLMHARHDFGELATEARRVPGRNHPVPAGLGGETAGG